MAILLNIYLTFHLLVYKYRLSPPPQFLIGFSASITFKIVNEPEYALGIYRYQ